MALVLSASRCLGLAVAGEGERFEVIDAGDTASAEHLEIFLPHRSIPICSVQQICHRSVLEPDDDRDIVTVIASSVRQSSGSDCLQGGTNDSSRPINEMTQLANNPATILRVLDPTASGDEPGIAADVYEHRLGAAGEEALQFFCKGRETAIKTHHEKRGA